MNRNKLINDINKEIEEKRIKLIKKEKEYREAKNALDVACLKLKKLQDECKHTNVIIHEEWKSLDIYYYYGTCTKCGKKGGRYTPQYQMEMHNKENPQNQITLEDAIEIGNEIKNSFFTSSYWWE